MDRYQTEQVIIRDPQIVVKSVCGQCNNGWMSDLEAKNIPVIGGMLNDLAITLDRSQQESVALWTVKTAIVLDSTRPREAGARFFLRDQCSILRENLAITPHTRTWIGRIASKHLLALGTDYRFLKPRVNSSIATFIMGHFVVQSITQKPPSGLEASDMPALQPNPDDGKIASLRSGRSRVTGSLGRRNYHSQMADKILSPIC